jgi:hypothetical protein
VSATEEVFGSDELVVGPNRTASIAIRLPWYRSLAPSTVEDVAVAVDGVEVPRRELTLEINGHADDLDTIAERWRESWFVQDRAILRFRAPANLGSTAQVALSVQLRIPYIITGPTSALSRTTEATRTLAVRREELT